MSTNAGDAKTNTMITANMTQEQIAEEANRAISKGSPVSFDKLVAIITKKSASMSKGSKGSARREKDAASIARDNANGWVNPTAGMDNAETARYYARINRPSSLR